LGISPKDQPPNHYRLLGIDRFESDPEVIDTAANRQMAFIQGCSTGPHLVLSQKLLNEVAAARLCLLNPAKKAAYDVKLTAQANVAANGLVVQEVTPQVANAEGETFPAHTFPSTWRARTHSHHPWKLPVILGGVALSVGFLVILAVS